MDDPVRNKEIVKEFITMVFHNHDLGNLDGIMRDDYIQHNVNVIGHHEFETENLANLIIKDIKSVSKFHQRIFSLQKNYEINYIRLRLIAGSLNLRVQKPVSEFRIFRNEFISVIRLFSLYLKVQINKNTTENAEIVIALSIIARKIYKYLNGKKR